MKKTNKTFKRFAAITSASLLAACAVAPVAFNAFAAPSTIEITNTNTDAAVHNYEAYQIFEGVMSDNKLTEIKWGTGIDDSKEAELLEALAAKNTQFAKNLVAYTIDESATNIQTAFDEWNTENGGGKEVKDYYDYLKGESGDTTVITITCDAKSAEKIADVLATVNDNDQLAKDFAEVVSKYLSTVKESSIVVNEEQAAEGGTYAAYDKDDVIIPGLADGYYLIQDAATSPGGTVSGDNSGAKTRFILKVTDNDTITINAKSAAPTVDKQVLDEKADAEEGAVEGWGETADHAINESFQFKLTATIPGNPEIASYDTYKIVFNDNMSNGVTFESIESIKVAGVDIKDDMNAWSDNISEDPEASMAGLDWSLTVNNVKAHIPTGKTWGTDDIVVEVIYNAHLNESAIVSDTDYDGVYSDVNNNNVYLQYSNNPNWEGSGSGVTEEFGTTKDDTVGVFTYKVTNTKYANSVGDGNILGGAEFELYSDEACTIKVPVKFVDGSNGKYYIPDVASGTNYKITSCADDGTFNFAGFDAGTYYVKETKAPDGYNLLTEVKTITITAVHAEKGDGTGATLTLNDENLSYDYINKAGTSLPGTGGIGTTIFYLGGGAMAAIGGIYLISKRRMRKSEE